MDYVYDHNGIRVGKTLNGTDVTKYIVDKNRPYAQVLEEQWSNGTLSATTGYVYGDALISRTTNGTPHFYHGACPERRRRDGMGSTHTLTDMSGTVTDTYSYDAYGLLLDKTGSAINPYLYRGEQVDDDLNSYYLRARYYQPGLGRFLTMDSEEGMLGDPLSAHRYLYGHNDPIHNLDPSGKSKLEDMMITVGMISTLASFSVQVFTMANEDFGDFFATLLPDAGTIGLSGSISVKVIKFLKLIFDDIPINTYYFIAQEDWSGLDTSIGGVSGFEALFSISSAQYGYYWYYGWQGEMGDYMGRKQEPININVSLSHGWVWNLWNTDDHVGPFYSANVGLGPHGGFSLFKDATRSLAEGPFGMSFSVLAWSPGGDAYSVGLSKTWYPRDIFDGKLKTYYFDNEKAGMYMVAIKLMACQAALFNLSVLTMETGIGSPLGAMTSLASAAWPMTIAMTKQIWNSRSHGGIDASVYARQNNPRPPEFRSRQRWIFWGGYNF